ncbi:MAG TPA: hypothetical protein VGN57_06240 [Pirellulaceae bacterium]|jgi:hypothetical protein|nr:hypothetical protein [Pirellulaceae bacterium]
MSERERKSKGEPGRALPNLPKFLQGKANPPVEKPKPATPPSPVIPPIDGAAPAKKQLPSAAPVKPQPVVAKPNQPKPSRPAATPPSPPVSSAVAKPGNGGPDRGGVRRPAPSEAPTRSPNAASTPAAKEPPAPASKRPVAPAPDAKPKAATATPPVEPPPARPSPVPSAAAPSPKVVAPAKAPAAPIASPELPAPESPVADSLASETGSKGEAAASNADHPDDWSEDVLPQAVSVSIVREAMAAEKAFRPILFAGPLKRAPKATPAEKNGSATHEPHAPAPVATTTDSHGEAGSTAARSVPASPSLAAESTLAAPPASELAPSESDAADGVPSQPQHASDWGPEPDVAEASEDAARGEKSLKPSRNAKESERRKSKRRKAVSSVLLAAAHRAKAASDAEEHREGRPFAADPWERLRASASAPSQAEGPTIRTERELDEEEITPDKIVRRTPPFLASLLLHLVLFVALAMIVLPGFQSRTALELDMNYATEDSDLLEAIELDLPTEMEVETTDMFSSDLATIGDPLESALDLPDTLGSMEMAMPGNLNQQSVAFSGRDEGTKQALLSAFGGTVATEDSVKLGLGWMKRYQQPDGRWLLSGPYTNGCSLDNPAAATSMALLAFLGDGHTPMEGEFRQAMTKGADALLRLQDSDGNFYVGPDGQHRLYTQAQATIAVCELYGMTGDERFRKAAELAVEYCVRSQAPEGGWRYYPGQESDTSVTGWFVMALKSAEMAGIDVPQESFDRISGYLDRVQDEEGWRYKYRIIERDFSKTMTAEGILCRQYLGWQRDDLRMKKGVDYLLQSPIATDEREIYYWYYASQTMHHYGGAEWEAWNENLREVLPAIQEKKGREQGSWSPRDDEWGSVGGRLFMTSLCLYTLEIYYRHLPLYQQAGDAAAKR